MAIDTMDSPVPQMQAETGFEVDDSAPPLRVSGFLCLLFGVLSFFCTLGQPLLIFPLMTFVIGMFALRRTGGQTPIGTRPALLGLVLAAGFGACGLFLPWMKTRTLGRQAEQFSKHYMDVVAGGHDAFALELRKDYINRFPPTMPLNEHYALNENSKQQLIEFQDESLNSTIRKLGPGAQWILDRPTRVYHRYGREHAEVVWIDASGETKTKVQFFLEYRIDSDGDGQWHVDVVQPYRELIVAESVL